MTVGEVDHGGPFEQMTQLRNGTFTARYGDAPPPERAHIGSVGSRVGGDPRIVACTVARRDSRPESVVIGNQVQAIPQRRIDISEALGGGAGSSQAATPA